MELKIKRIWTYDAALDNIHGDPKHWKAAWDESGRVYYYNKCTLKTSWTLPLFNAQRDKLVQVKAFPMHLLDDLRNNKLFKERQFSQQFEYHVIS